MFDIRKMQEQALYESVKAVGGERAAREIACGAPGENDADWVKNAMRRLEKRFDGRDVKEIRMRCQCGYGMDEKLALVLALYEDATDFDTFANCARAREAGLFFENGTLYLQFAFCPCPMLQGVDRLQTDAWCQCTTGYSKVLFEKVFGCTVDVTLLKSIKMGDDICLMEIEPAAPVF